ncbi:MAG: hypothetical protein ACE5Q6_14175 [Dehalococcoidia bacterium]
MTEIVERDADLHDAEVTPLFYSVPCAGVRYYTYDFQAALQEKIRRWTSDSEEKSKV